MTPAAFVDNPNWADFLPEFREPARRRHLPTHEDCTPLDESKAAEHLRRGGTLGAMPGYEERPGQIDMLRAVVRAFDGRDHLMIEAGTGVGKSLAYLVPSILWAAANDTTVVVSTATRNLQSQLVHADIPKALAVLGENRGDFKAALLKGRSNYLCLREVGAFFSSGYWTMSEEEQRLLPGFIEWLQSTPDGDLDSYEGLPRSQLTCPGEECGGRRCPYYTRCFVYRARKRAAEAHLVIANHALVLAEATNPGGGILPSYARLVLDEAHNLEEIATDYLSREFSLPVLTQIMNRLLRRRKGKRGGSGGVLASVERQLQKGVLAGSVVADRVRHLVAEIPSRLVRVTNATEDVLSLGELLLRPAGERGICRYKVGIAGERAAGPARMHSLHGLFEPYKDWSEARLKAAQSGFEAELAGMVNVLHELSDALERSAPEGELNYCMDLATQVKAVAESLIGFANDADFVLAGDKDTHAYWAERMHPVKRTSYVRLVAAPLSVAADLKRMLYDVKDSVVLSSATLRVGSDFRYMAKRLGADGDDSRFRCLVAESPFDYLRQAQVLAADCLPDPSAEPQKYADALAALMRDLFTATSGRALVLFTSYEMMNAVARHARGELEAAGIRLLVQGEGMSRESMTRALNEESSTVLFGAQSFWEGVDVAGEALSCVVIARLPFGQVGDPVYEARGEKIAREGGSAFRDYSLPEAVIRFRQGFGRLIRTKRDRGVVVVTDPRLVTKNYGAIFRRSLPASVHTVTGEDELLERVREFFE